jgi:hypothetical protein
MITSAQEMLCALKGSKPQFSGLILWQGASALDGQPVVAIANRIIAKSNNAKTGHMVQTFIIRSDVHPGEALKTGDDASVCGDCIHRPFNGGACYVQVNKSVASVFKAYQRGRYARPGVDYDPRILPDLFEGMVFRLGSYGDPTAIPFQVWRACTLKVKAKAGYTHQWRNPAFAAFKLLCMASCDSVADVIKAEEMGFRSFRVRRSDEALRDREITCPASAEAGYKTNCASCRACGGLEAKAKVNIAIVAHGPVANRFANAQAALIAA